jgi:hypothetical protein
MKANVGGIDKVLRVVAGVALLGLGFAGVVPMMVGLIGIIPLATGLMGWCPFYPLLGLNTCPMEKK